MRELIYRVWDKESECYLDETDILGITPDGEFILYRDEPDEVCILEVKDSFIIEQFTGLYDRDGKKIYAGDIVKVQSEELYPFDLGIVGFDDRKGIYDFYVIERGKIYWDSGCDQCSRMAREGYTTEVIGNIHENKELLK